MDPFPMSMLRSRLPDLLVPAAHPSFPSRQTNMFWCTSLIVLTPAIFLLYLLMRYWSRLWSTSWSWRMPTWPASISWGLILVSSTCQKKIQTFRDCLHFTLDILSWQYFWWHYLMSLEMKFWVSFWGLEISLDTLTWNFKLCVWVCLCSCAVSAVLPLLHWLYISGGVDWWVPPLMQHHTASTLNQAWTWRHFQRGPKPHL